ncbi:MAG: glycosyltransferase [Patescibacteria group bacterium]
MLPPSYKSGSGKVICSVRGPITWSDFNELRMSLEKDWGRLEHTPELVIFFQGDRDIRVKINLRRALLVWKERSNGGLAEKRKVEASFNLGHIRELLEILSSLGLKEVLFSNTEVYKSHKGKRHLYINFGSRIGDFFELQELADGHSGLGKIRGGLTRMAERYGLKIWSRKAYHKIFYDSWRDFPPQPIISNGQVNAVVAEFLEQGKSERSRSLGRKTIAERLGEHSNDYSNLVDVFRVKLGVDLLSSSPLPSKVGFNSKVSVVIPTYNSVKSLKVVLESLDKQILNGREFANLEIIVIDDGSTDSTPKILVNGKYKFQLRYYRQNRMGRAQARNIGTSLARGDVLIFLDSDTSVDSNFIREHVVRQELLENAVVVSFKENVNSKDHRISGETIPKPDINKDFRFEKEVKGSWLRMHRHVRHVEIRKVRILDETDNFKEFGGGRVVGVWDLPSMVVSNAISMRSSEFRAVGGFNLQFEGWGMEDTFLGACLIARGNYVIPCLSTGVYHIEHPPRSGSKLKRLQEFNKNVLVYLDLIHRPLRAVVKGSARP